MISPTSKLGTRWRLCGLLGVCALAFISGPRMVGAQGLVKGVEQGAREGNRAAGPVAYPNRPIHLIVPIWLLFQPP